MLRKTLFFLLLCAHSAFSKNITLSMNLSANLYTPTCSISVPVGFEFGNININDFLRGDTALRTKTISITASCPYISSVDVMLIPQHGTVSGRNNEALTSNASVMYSVSLVDLGVNNVNFNTNTSWSSPGTTSIRMTLAPNGTLSEGSFNTSMAIQLTYF